MLFRCVYGQVLYDFRTYFYEPWKFQEKCDKQVKCSPILSAKPFNEIFIIRLYSFGICHFSLNFPFECCKMKKIVCRRHVTRIDFLCDNIALKIVCRRNVTSIDFLCNNIALKIVCRRHVTSIDFLCDNIALKIVVKNRPV